MRYYCRLAVLVPAALALSGCGSLKVWERWDNAERARYFGLTWIAPDSVLEAYRALPERSQRDSCYRRYWDEADPTGQAEAEHRKRVAEAQQQFGDEQFYRDDRSASWVRHGNPDVRLAYYAQPHALEGHRLSRATIVREQPWEIWEFHREGLSADFLQRGDYFKIVSEMTSDRRHPVAFFRPDTAVAAVVDTAGFRREALEAQWARFKSERPDRVRWELYWWLPMEQLAGDGYLAVIAIADGEGNVRTDSIPYRLVQPPGSLPEPFAFGQRNFDLRPGRYRATVALVDPAGRAVYQAGAEAELVAYRRGSQEVSDVELAVLQDTTFIAPEFQKGPYRRVIPFPGTAVKRFQPFFVYYEIYHLALGADSSHHLRISQQIFSSDQQGQLKECLINTDPVESQEKGSTYRGCHKIHLLSYGLPTGPYILRINAEDLATGRKAALTLRFDVDGSGWGRRPAGTGKRAREMPSRDREAQEPKGRF